MLVLFDADDLLSHSLARHLCRCHGRAGDIVEVMAFRDPSGRKEAVAELADSGIGPVAYRALVLPTRAQHGAGGARREDAARAFKTDTVESLVGSDPSLDMVYTTSTRLALAYKKLRAVVLSLL